MSFAATVRVRRGARWLDENFPGWTRRVDPNTLNLSDGEKCICGQVFESQATDDGATTGFDFAVSHLFAEANHWISAIVGSPRKDVAYPGDVDFERADLVATALGFNCGTLMWCPSGSLSDEVWVSFAELQTAWEKLLAKRRASF